MGTLAAEMIGKWMKEYEGKLLDTADFIFCHPEVSLKEKASSPEQFFGERGHAVFLSAVNCRHIRSRYQNAVGS